MGTTFIYALCEPGTRTVRYIGKADKPKHRFSQHLRDSVKKNNHLGCWLRSIKSIGEKPNLVLLCEVSVDQRQIEEMRYIRSAKVLGMDLVNSTDGGEGMQNPSAETRSKMSAANSGEKNSQFGKIRSTETRAKQSASITGEKNHQFGKKPWIFGKKLIGSSSKFYGLYWEAPRKRWHARIKINGKYKFLGSFKNEVDAAWAYDKAVTFYGTPNPLNFPNE